MGMLKLAAGVAVGYVLGSRAGREKYENIAATARKVGSHPTVVQAQEKVKGFIGTGGSTSGAAIGSSSGSSGGSVSGSSGSSTSGSTSGSATGSVGSSAGGSTPGKVSTPATTSSPTPGVTTGRRPSPSKTGTDSSL